MLYALFMRRIWVSGLLTCVMAGGQVRPDTGEAGARLAEARGYLAKGDVNHARQEAETLYARNPSDVAVAILLANCYIKLGRAEEAVKVLEPLEPQNHANSELEYSLAFAMMQSKGDETSLKRMEELAGTIRGFPDDDADTRRHHVFGHFRNASGRELRHLHGGLKFGRGQAAGHCNLKICGLLAKRSSAHFCR